MAKTRARIAKGYCLKARKIDDSDIAHAPPHVRETWDWSIRNANHSDQRCGNTIIRRGQLLTSYRQIRQALHWKKGWQKCMYSSEQIETAIKTLRKTIRITTQKTRRGLIITIVNYDFYQNPANYDNHTDNQMDNRTDNRTTNKNERKKKCKYSYKERDLRLAQLLWGLVHDNHPNIAEPNLKAWADEVRKLSELDRRTTEQVEAVFRWSQSDNFWSGVCLSAACYRRKGEGGVKRIDRIEAQMKKEKRYGSSQISGDFAQESEIGETIAAQ